MTKRGNAFYTSFDVLLDTRMGTLEKLDPELANAAVVANYHERVSDMFAGIDREAYKEAYRTRDIETLQCSYVTNAPSLIMHFVSIAQQLAVERAEVEPLRMEVNCYPYVLTPQLHDIYLEVFHEIFPQISDIRIINVAEKDLSIDYCKEVYRMMFMYEYAEWLEARSKDFETVQASDMMVYAPAIYHEKVPTQADLDEIRKQIPPLHPFEAVLFQVRPFVGLHLLDVKHFSLLSLN